MKTITKTIGYYKVSPAVLSNCVFADVLGWCSWREVDEENFEFSVYCRCEDAPWVEEKLTQYV